MIDPGVCAYYAITRDRFVVTHHETGIEVEIPRQRIGIGKLGLRDVRNELLAGVLRREARVALNAVRFDLWPRIAFV